MNQTVDGKIKLMWKAREYFLKMFTEFLNLIR